MDQVGNGSIGASGGDWASERFIRLDVVDSTNNVAKRLLAENAIRGGTCLIAGSQTAGRGTRGRSWASPPGAGLYLSVVRCPPPPIRGGAGVQLYTLAAGVACVQVIREATGIPVEIKPINDLVVAGGKLGGILTEVVWHGEVGAGLIVGVGINVLPADRPVDPGALVPVCLADLVAGRFLGEPGVETLTQALVRNLDRWLNRVDRREDVEVYEVWNRHRTDHGSTLDGSKAFPR